jgi:nucleotide-binding universal stress UspA family protein
MLAGNEVIILGEDPMSKNMVLAVDAASGDVARHVGAAADMTGELGRDSGDHVIVLHVHEFATGRFGRIQVDCYDGAGEQVVEKVVSGLQAAGVSAEGEIRETHVGHIAAAILKAADEHDARIVVLGSSSRTDLPRFLLGSVASRLLHMATRPVLIVPRTGTPTQAAQMAAATTAAGEH